MLEYLGICYKLSLKNSPTSREATIGYVGGVETQDGYSSFETDYVYIFTSKL